jgi:DNA-binding IclR family transcriptional regulator
MKAEESPQNRYVVDAVAKAFDILEVFDTSEGLTLNEIRQQVGLNKSRIFRLLHTMTERGYVERTTNGARYKLGVKLLERASYVHRNLKDLARSFMLQLQEHFNETVNLGVLDGLEEVLYVDIVESSRPFRMIASAGCRTPAAQTSMGKAMLAHLRLDDPASPHHARAVELWPDHLAEFCRELEVIRTRGYALDKEENEPGVGCVGAAILDAGGRPVAAMSVSGPSHRILASEKEIAEALVAACTRVSRTLGFGSTSRATNRDSARYTRYAGAME